ncbi:MAG: YlxM family DNA-binding protein [Oscillospiraceae bacterium]|nr:YlxM family DNA-binding protein [Oscillospiraceae bacterium]
MSKNLEMSYLLDFYGNVLTEKQRDIMQQYYHMDLSLSEIADNFGITRQGVRDAIKRGENILTELEEQVGFAEKYRSLMDGMEKIKAYAQNIAFYNTTSYTTNDDIQKSAVDIMTIVDTLTEQEG